MANYISRSLLDIEALRTAFPERVIEHYETIDSTMHRAAQLQMGSVVLAEEQTAGQGRHGHTWHSEPNAGIYCSVVLEPAPLLTMAIGLATADAIAAATGIACDLRWPNDLMIGTRKVAGILVQLVDGRAIAGIGINVNHTQFPPELAAEATSLRLANPGRSTLAGPSPAKPSAVDAPPPVSPSVRIAPATPGAPPNTPGTPLSRDAILLKLLPALGSFLQEDAETILRLFAHASSYVSGRRVLVQLPDGAIEGVTVGLDAAGFLQVRQDDGTVTLILAGGVRAAGT